MLSASRLCIINGIWMSIWIHGTGRITVRGYSQSTGGKTVQCHFVHCTYSINYPRMRCRPLLWEDGNYLSVLCLKNMPYCMYICILQIEWSGLCAKTRFNLSIKQISLCRIWRAGIAVTLAPQLLLIFYASHFLSIQQAQYLADGDVSEVICFPQMLAQVPIFIPLVSVSHRNMRTPFRCVFASDTPRTV